MGGLILEVVSKPHYFESVFSFFLRSMSLRLYFRLLLSGPLYEEVPPILRPFLDRLILPLLFSVTFDLLYSISAFIG